MGVPMWRVAELQRERVGQDAYRRNLATLRAVLPQRFRQVALAAAGYGSLHDLRRATDEELLAVPQMGPVLLRQLRAWLAAQPPPPVTPLPDWVLEE